MTDTVDTAERVDLGDYETGLCRACEGRQVVRDYACVPCSGTGEMAEVNANARKLLAVIAARRGTFASTKPQDVITTQT